MNLQSGRMALLALCLGCTLLSACKQWDAESLVRRGTEYAFVGDFKPAIDYYTRAIGMDPSYAKAYRLRAIALMTLARHKEATPDWNRTVEFDPDNADSYYNRGINYYFLKQTARACVDLARACRMEHQLGCNNHDAHCSAASPPAPGPPKRE